MLFRVLDSQSCRKFMFRRRARKSRKFKQQNAFRFELCVFVYQAAEDEDLWESGDPEIIY
jgi:hypothetical protein